MTISASWTATWDSRSAGLGGKIQGSPAVEVDGVDGVRSASEGSEAAARRHGLGVVVPDSHRLLIRAEVLQLSHWTVGGEETPNQGMDVGPGVSVPR